MEIAEEKLQWTTIGAPRHVRDRLKRVSVLAGKTMYGLVEDLVKAEEQRLNRMQYVPQGKH